eukprot:1145377-Pelagomonas_calceolata.AAC.1
MAGHRPRPLEMMAPTLRLLDLLNCTCAWAAASGDKTCCVDSPCSFGAHTVQVDTLAADSLSLPPECGGGDSRLFRANVSPFPELMDGSRDNLELSSNSIILFWQTYSEKLAKDCLGFGADLPAHLCQLQILDSLCKDSKIRIAALSRAVSQSLFWFPKKDSMLMDPLEVCTHLIWLCMQGFLIGFVKQVMVGVQLEHE